ncbi:phage tail sheath family protein [Nannocystis radixulma]|uniref:Phage tail sheath subtilisin-like domain-containing protein n=1 Tax=Nannocystis radixulma TaxID=2995305 RepID=A0ABT5BIS9_9BACT|nr:phage tail sheath subtilisin-like domain-containing protein [Nannocystis radixulma]MDC0672861.1 phage tail sheath subtilisin-like domain-containing protein [Nannocystis radixulma]
MDKPTRVFNFTEFAAKFGLDTKRSELATQVRLFFANGGTQAYIMRIADEAAAPASVTLKDISGADSIKITAREAGATGNDLRVAVDYATEHPEETFNLRIFRVNAVTLQETELEVHANLSMQPGTARFVDDIVGQNSTLVTAARVAAAPATRDAYSIGARVIGGTDIDDLAIPDPSTIGLSVDGGDPANSVYTAGVFGPLPAGVTASVVVVETGKVLLKIRKQNGSVKVLPSGAVNDIATLLHMGVAQGGLEGSAYATQRPAPTGMFATLSDTNLGIFAGLDQTQFEAADDVDITVGTLPALEDFNLKTTASGKFYTGNVTSADSLWNVREKLQVLASQFNAKAQAKTNFNWRLEAQGFVLVFSPTTGEANAGLGVSIGSTKANFLDGDGYDLGSNTRYYSLGESGTGTHQAGDNGVEGGRPLLADYSAAFEVIDREVDIFNLLILPRDADALESHRLELWGPASIFCQRRRAFLLIDPPSAWTSTAEVTGGPVNIATLRQGLVKDHSAIYWPRLLAVNEQGLIKPVDPSGAVAGLMARTDANRGVWKAPAGLEADIRGIMGVERQMSDPDNGVINAQAVNAERVFPSGIVVWGARTMDGFDNSGNNDYKYVPVRRFALFLAESLRRGLQFAVFEPNDEPLWAQIRLAAGAFMHGLFRQGAFQGQKKSDAYFVKVDAETTTQNDINLGIVNVIVGFAPLKPAEFVVIQLKQMAGQIQT